MDGDWKGRGDLLLYRDRRCRTAEACLLDEAHSGLARTIHRLVCLRRAFH